MSMQDHSRVETLYTCGIILSPNFPGLVEPGLWFWTFTPPDDQTIYFDVTLFYVRGPGVKDPLCEQNFKSMYYKLIIIDNQLYYFKDNVIFRIINKNMFYKI